MGRRQSSRHSLSADYRRNPAQDFGTPVNPFGCWIGGATPTSLCGKGRKTSRGYQAMLDRLTSHHDRGAAAPKAAAATLSGLVVNDVTDTGAALAWLPVAAPKAIPSAAPAAPMRALSQSARSRDELWRCRSKPATSYIYQVTATIGGSERPGSVSDNRDDASRAAPLRRTRHLPRRPIEHQGAVRPSPERERRRFRATGFLVSSATRSSRIAAASPRRCAWTKPLRRRDRGLPRSPPP